MLFAVLLVGGTLAVNKTAPMPPCEPVAHGSPRPTVNLSHVYFMSCGDWEFSIKDSEQKLSECQANILSSPFETIIYAFVNGVKNDNCSKRQNLTQMEYSKLNATV